MSRLKVTWSSLVHVELAGYQNLQDLNQRIQTGLRSAHKQRQSRFNVIVQALNLC